MNETRRKPTTGRQSPSLFDKWHGIYYMPSRIDEAGHTKAFDYPVAEHCIDLQTTSGNPVLTMCLARQAADTENLGIGIVGWVGIEPTLQTMPSILHTHYLHYKMRPRQISLSSAMAPNPMSIHTTMQHVPVIRHLIG